MSICNVSRSRGICAWYVMLNTPLQDGVIEMWNSTLMKMVRIMLSCYTLPFSLWIYALKTTMYMLN